MECFVIRGGVPLCGSMQVHTAKNAVLPIMAAACMTKETVRIRACPQIVDARIMLEILEKLGCRVTWEGEDVCIDTAPMRGSDMPEALSKKLRSSVFLTGVLLARFGSAVITHPGGCEIGLRPIDLHLSGLRALGAHITERDGRILIEGERRRCIWIIPAWARRRTSCSPPRARREKPSSIMQQGSRKLPTSLVI